MNKSNNPVDEVGGNFFIKFLGHIKRAATSNTGKSKTNNVFSESENEQKMLAYSDLIGELVANIAKENKETLKHFASSYLEEKKQNYDGLAYLEQLEKNYVYLEHCVATLSDHINLFLLGQENAPNTDKINDVLNQIRLSTRSESSAHMKYLAFGCDGCDYHAGHTRYTKLRGLRLKDINAYVEELEIGCSSYKASLTLSQTCLGYLWDSSNRQYAESVNWDKNKMNEILFMYIKYTVSCVLNDLPLPTLRGMLLRSIDSD